MLTRKRQAKQGINTIPKLAQILSNILDQLPRKGSQSLTLRWKCTARASAQGKRSGQALGTPIYWLLCSAPLLAIQNTNVREHGKQARTKAMLQLSTRASPLRPSSALWDLACQRQGYSRLEEFFQMCFLPD